MPRNLVVSGIGRRIGAAVLALLLAPVAQQVARGAPNGIRPAAEEGMQMLAGHSDGISALAFSPDGKLLASGSGDRSIIISDAHTGKLLHRLDGHSAAISSLAFSPDGKYLLSAAAEETVDLWSTASWQIQSLYEAPGLVDKVAFLPDSRRFIVDTRYYLDLDQVEPAKGLVRTRVAHGITALLVNGGDLLIGDLTGTISKWDPQTGKVTALHHRPRSSPSKAGGDPQPNNWIISLAPGPDGHVLVCDSDGIWDWDRKTDQLSYAAKRTFGPAGMLYHNDYILSGWDRGVWLRQADPKGISIEFKLGYRLNALAISPAGDLWAYGGRGGWPYQGEWHRGPRADVRVLRTKALPHAFDLAMQEKTAAHKAHPNRALDPTAVSDTDTPQPGWDETTAPDTSP